ncbi:MAG: GFA family protein [Pseudomonadota bacterium]
MSDTVTGGCQCGAIRYRATSLGRASICHCRMCQRAVGNAMTPLVVARGVAWEGTPAWFASSNISERGFCAICGTPLFLRDVDGPEGEIEIMIATLDEPEQAIPAHHYGVESRLSWVKLADGLPEYQTGTGGGTDPATIRSFQDPAALAAKEET